MRDYLFFGLACIIMFFLVDRKIKFPWYYKLFFLVYPIGSYLLGNYFNLYRMFPYYDKIQHVITPLFLVLLFGYAYAKLLPSLSKTPRWIFAFVTVFALLALYECYEWSYDSLGFEPSYIMGGVFNIQGKQLMNAFDDTMLDLICGAAGSLFGGIIGWAGDWINDKEDSKDGREPDNQELAQGNQEISS
jgi:hypothetical protein